VTARNGGMTARNGGNIGGSACVRATDHWPMFSARITRWQPPSLDGTRVAQGPDGFGSSSECALTKRKTERTIVVKKWTQLVSATGVLASLFLLPGTASADMDMWMWGLASAEVQVGMVGNQAYLAARDPTINGNCHWLTVGNADGKGLKDNLIVRPHPEFATGRFTMTVTTGTNSWCGATWSPLLFNGYWVSFNGHSDSDTLVSASYMNGGNGADLIIGNPATPHSISGGGGGDLLYVGHGGRVYGGVGPDMICALFNGTPSIVSGNNGWGSNDGATDTYCGPWPSSNSILDIQNVNTLCLCP
jgi:hypothetical protein